MRWDIFCQVIDNHGDLGVCWRLAADLARRGHAVRLWVDDPAALAWMAPRRPATIELVHWRQPPSVAAAVRLPHGTPVVAGPGDVVIEAFGCEIDHAFMAGAPAPAPQPRWINLEYLSAEAYVERSHGLPSPVMGGPAAGRRKFFFYPGFTERTGGLLREPGLAGRLRRFDRATWLSRRGLAPLAPGERLVTLFCYEPATLAPWLAAWTREPQRTRLLVTPGRARAAVQAALQALQLLPPGRPPGPPADGSSVQAGSLSIHGLPHLAQPVFDELLWSGDLNFVRGEDSLVRAIWAGRPFVWHIYPQHDGAHWPKLHAFLDRWLDGAPADTAALVRQWHGWWNADAGSPGAAPPCPALSPRQLARWREWALAARERLWRQDDLATQLIRFIGQTG